MSATCAANSLQGEFIKETGRNFLEWQYLLLSVPHESKNAAIKFLMLQGLSKNKSEFLVLSTASRLTFTGDNT